MAYPTRGVELIVPSNAEAAIFGWRYGVNFNRRGHDYAVQFCAAGISVTRDGEEVRRWDDLPGSVQAVIVKAKASFEPTFSAPRSLH